MPVAVHITPQHISKEDYERVMKELEESGAGNPGGRVSQTRVGGGEVDVHPIDSKLPD